ncbi:MAG: PAS domain S-box protein [Betaproteobacteria bacterium]|nr:PAS domain S-box protein [Betaproteobacteria bacterium]
MFNGKRTLVAYLMAALLTGGILGHQLWSGYDQQVRSARSTVENLAWVLQQRLDATLRRTDSTLEELVRTADPQTLRGDARAAFEGRINAVLAARRVKFPEMSAFRFIDAGGNLLYTSDPVKSFANLADRPYFGTMRDNPEAGLVYSDVQVSRFTGQTVIVIGRGIRDASGKFLGAAIAVLDLASYAGLFDSLDLGRQGLIAIRRTDSRLVLRKPADPSLVNKAIGHPIQKLIDEGQTEGTIVYTAFTDGIERLFAFRRVPDYPFYFIVGISTGEMLAGWRTQAAITAGLALLALAIFTALLLGLSRARAREAENALRLEEREKNMRYVLDAAGEGIWNWDIGGNLMRVNTRFCEILGMESQNLELTAEELARHALRSELGAYREDLVRCLKGKSSLAAEHRIRRENGDIVWAQFRGDVVERDASGRALRMVGSIADITQRKLASEQLARSELELQTIIDTEPDCVELLAADGALTKINQAGLTMIGAGSFEQVAGMPLQTLVAAEYRDAFADLTRRVFAGESGKLEFEIVGLQGARRWLATHAVPLRDTGGNILALLGVTRDISERKKNEAELLDAVQAAEAANRTKSAFLATMSHEIRTPLNGILGMAQLLLMPVLSEEERREFARTILNSGQTLLTLLNDILDLSKVEAGKLELAHAAFEPRQIVAETTGLFAELAQSKGVSIKAEWRGAENQRYRADPVRVRQMLSNLIGNAVKFTARGFVRIEAGEVERTGHTAILEFSVSDSGIGIPGDKLSLLFDPFTQADSSTTREYGGTGLGLSIVRSLARLMDGDVYAESEAGKGSRFWFRIRADIVHGGEESRRVERAARTVQEAGEPAGLSGNVLVVEDNPTNRKVIEALLGKLNITATSVENGQQAVAATTGDRRPDLVLMDVQMPVMDGLDATGHIRRWEVDHNQPHLPIVALTAGAFGEDRRRCMDAGMDDFLTKPVNMDALAATLANWMGK